MNNNKNNNELLISIITKFDHCNVNLVWLIVIITGRNNFAMIIMQVDV